MLSVVYGLYDKVNLFFSFLFFLNTHKKRDLLNDEFHKYIYFKFIIKKFKWFYLLIDLGKITRLIIFNKVRN